MSQLRYNLSENISHWTTLIQPCSSSVFNHHTRPEGGSSEPNEPLLDPPLINIDDFLSDVLSSPSLLGLRNLSTLSCSRAAPLFPHYSTNMLHSSPISPNVLLSPVHASTLHDLRSSVRRTENLYKRTHTALSSTIAISIVHSKLTTATNCTIIFHNLR